MVLHPWIHLEIARQRHQDLLARAERHRIAKACDHATAEAMVDEAIGAVPSTSHDERRVESRRRGELLYLRQLRASDRQALIEGFSRLSSRTRYQRFAAPKPKLTRADLDRLTDVDPPRSDALGAFLGQGDQLVGFAHYAGGDEPRGPELAVVVVDDWQRRGVGTTLAKLIIARAHASRHSVVHAHVLAGNQAGLRFVQRLGFRSAGRDGLFVVLELAIHQLRTNPSY